MKPILQRLFPVAFGLVMLYGCSGQVGGSRTGVIPASDAVMPAPPALTAAFVAGLPHAQIPPMPNGLNIATPPILKSSGALQTFSTVGSNDNEVLGTLINAGGHYTAIYAQHTAYQASSVALSYPNGASGSQQVLAPVSFPPSGSCLADGTASVNNGSTVSTYFVVFDVCGGGFKHQIVAIPIDATFVSKYVSATSTTHSLPVYATVVGTFDAVPTVNSTWEALIYNRITGIWEVVATEKGLNGTKYGLSSYISYYQPGACPSGLPTLAANAVQLYTPGVGYESVTSVMLGTTTSVLNRPSSAQCFYADSTGPASSVFTMVTPNQYWTVTSGAPNVGYAYDDWIAFAHDSTHTGFQSQPTGISTATVSKLALRWKITLPGGAPVYSSPLAYKGNIIVVAEGPPGIVYDLSAADGHVLWSHRVTGGVSGTPTIDPSAGLVFVGDRIVDSAVHPSYVYALHLSNGTPAWFSQVNGITHQGPTVAGGVVYQGTSGGDPPDCLNGGVSALDELTGNTKWVWYVNSQTNPGGGGSVWGAIAFDGDRIIFGTGNVSCGSQTLKLPTSNGAVALDLNGHLLWSFIAQQNSYWDYDTGGGTMLSNGVAMFKNKTGILYSIDPATGTLLHQTQVDPYFGYGEFPSPSTDGSTTVISWGVNPTPAPGAPAASVPKTESEQRAVERRISQWAFPITSSEQKTHENLESIEWHTRHHPFFVLAGYDSALVGINRSGTVIWTHTMTSMLVGYAAIVNGVVIADDDYGLSAFDLHTGTRLWTYAFPSLPEASPAIVPSGVYAADGGGHVYAFALPHS